MTNLPYILSIVATTIEMTACIICARYLWSVREASRDRSRQLLALGSLVSGVMATFALIWSVTFPMGTAQMEFLQPVSCLLYLAMHIIMTLYPISVVRPGWLTPARMGLLFLPLALLVLVFLIFIGRWTPLFSAGSVWALAYKPDVIVRLAALFVMVPYCLILLVLPHNYSRSSANFWWILNYCFGLLIICMVHIALMLTYYLPLIIALPILAALFFLLSTEFELNDRLVPNPLSDIFKPAQEEFPADGSPAHEAPASMETELWPRVIRVMDKEELWKDPNLTLVSLAHHCATNITSLNRTIKQETGGGFKELLNAKRIASVVAQLQENPDTDIQSAFFNAGYRSRTTAWRNFKDIMGISPADYRASLEQVSK